MSNSILHEANRIREIMGLTIHANLLSEQIAGLLDDIITPLTKIVKSDDMFRQMDSKLFDDIVRIGKAAPESIGKTFKKIPDGATLKNLYDSLDEEAQKFVVKQLVKQGVPQLDKVLYRVVAEAMGATEEELITLAKSFDTLEGWTNYLKTGAESLDPDVLVRLRKLWTDVTPKSKEILDVTKVKKLAELVNKKGGKIWYGDFWSALFTKTEKLRNRLVSLSDEYTRKMELADAAEAEQLTKAYAVEMTRTLNKIEMQMNEAAADALKTLDLDERLITTINTSQDTVIKMFRDLRNEDPTGLAEGVWNTAKTFLSNNVLPSIKLGGPIKKVIDFFKKNTDEIATETSAKYKENGRWISISWPTDLKQFLLTGQWAKFSTLYKKAIQLNAADKTNPLRFANYFGQIIIKSYIGTLLGGVMYALIDSIATATDMKLAINNIFATFNLKIPFPNAEEDAKADFKTGIGKIGFYFTRSIKEIFGDADWVVPFIGTFEQSALAKVIEYATNTPTAGMSPTGVIQVLLESFSGGEELPPELQDTGETTTGETTTLVLDYESVKNAAPEHLKEWIWVDSEGHDDVFQGKVYLMADETTDYEVVVQDNEYAVKVGDEIIKLSEY